MPARSERPLKKICARIFEDNYDVLNEVADLRGVPFNTIVREMIDTFCRQTFAEVRKKIDEREEAR